MELRLHLFRHLIIYPAPMSELVRGTIEEAVKELGIDYTVIPSGAFHDSPDHDKRIPDRNDFRA